MISLAASFATWLTVASTVIAAIAAIATIVAVYFAHQTVVKTDEAAAAEAKRHTEQIKKLERVTSSAQEAHQEEMRDRKATLERELVVRRIAQMQRIADLANRLQSTATEEVINPETRSYKEADGSWHSTPVTRLPPLQLLLRVEGTTLSQLGGPGLMADMPRFGSGVPPGQVANDAGDLLLKIQDLLVNDQSLKLPAGTD